MATLSIISNPRRKRRKGRKARRRSHSRRARARILKVASNPKRRRRRSRGAHLFKKRRSRRSGGKLLSGGLVRSTQSLVKHAAYAAVGAIGLDLVWAYLPIPPVLRTGYVRFVAKGAGAVAIGMVAERFLGRDLGAKFALGAMTVVMHDAMRDLAAQFVPQVSLGGVGDSDFPSMGYTGSAPVAGMGEYMNALPDYYGTGYSQTGNFQGMGEYVSDNDQ